MKKILFVLSNMNIGGTEKAFLNLADTLSPEEYDVTLLLLEKKGGFIYSVPSWIHLETMEAYSAIKREIMEPPLPIIGEYLKSGRLLRAVCLFFTHVMFKLTGNRTLYYKFVLRGTHCLSGYDAAIAYSGPFDFITAFVLFKVHAAKKIQWIHFDVSKFCFNTRTCRSLYQRFDEINVVSNEARLSLIDKMPGLEAKIKTRYNTVSADRCIEMADLGRGFEDEHNKMRIVTLGRLSEEKGQGIIPAVAAALRELGVQFKWYLIGEGPLRGELLTLAEQFKLENELVLLGSKSNPYPYLKQADVYVQTSVHEGYCISLAEAKLFGMPIVSTDFAGAHEQLDGCADCYVVERSVEALSAGLIHALRAAREKDSGWH